MENIAKEPAQDAGPAVSGGRKFGRLGLGVGIFGRWSRLMWGVATLLPLAFGGVQDLQNSGSSLSFYGLAGVYVVGISAAYVAVYWAFGERIFARANPWVNTAVFVGPAFVVAWWDIVFGPRAGLSLPTALPLAASVYIGISFILQWKIRYGGCEVVAIPIILSKRRYTTCCLPLVALDAV